MALVVTCRRLGTRTDKVSKKYRKSSVHVKEAESTLTHEQAIKLIQPWLWS